MRLCAPKAAGASDHARGAPTGPAAKRVFPRGNGWHKGPQRPQADSPRPSAGEVQRALHVCGASSSLVGTGSASSDSQEGLPSSLACPICFRPFPRGMQCAPPPPCPRHLRGSRLPRSRLASAWSLAGQSNRLPLAPSQAPLRLLRALLPLRRNRRPRRQLRGSECAALPLASSQSSASLLPPRPRRPPLVTPVPPTPVSARRRLHRVRPALPVRL